MEFKSYSKCEKEIIWIEKAANTLCSSALATKFLHLAAGLSSCPLSQISQFFLLGATQLYWGGGRGGAQAGHVGGSPTLAVWPEVALAALGYVDDHGAVPTATIPPQPIGLVGAPVDSFLRVTCASADREGGKNTGKWVLCGGLVFFSLNYNFWCSLNQNVMCEECGYETPTFSDSWHAKHCSWECRGCSGVGWSTFTVDAVWAQQAFHTTSTWVFAQGQICHLIVW